MKLRISDLKKLIKEEVYRANRCLYKEDTTPSHGELTASYRAKGPDQLLYLSDDRVVDIREITNELRSEHSYWNVSGPPSSVQFQTTVDKKRPQYVNFCKHVIYIASQELGVDWIDTPRGWMSVSEFGNSLPPVDPEILDIEDPAVKSQIVEVVHQHTR